MPKYALQIRKHSKSQQNKISYIIRHEESVKRICVLLTKKKKKKSSQLLIFPSSGYSTFCRVFSGAEYTLRAVHVTVLYSSVVLQ